MDEELRKHVAALMRQNAPKEAIDAFIADWQSRPHPAITLPSLPTAAPVDQTAPGAEQYPVRAKDVARSVGQGLTARFADEGEALVRAAGSAIVPNGRDYKNPIQTYRDTRDDIRKQNAEFTRHHPNLSMGSELVGGLLPMALSGGAAAAGEAGAGARGLWSLAKSSGGTGLKYGLATGLGGAEGDLKSQATSTAMGGAGGLIVGGLLSPAARLAGKAREHIFGGGKAVQERMGTDFAKSFKVPFTQPESEAAALFNTNPELAELAKRGMKSSKRAEAIYKERLQAQKLGENPRSKAAITGAVGEEPLNIPGTQEALKQERLNVIDPQYKSALFGAETGVDDPAVMAAAKRLRGEVSDEHRIIPRGESHGHPESAFWEQPPAAPTVDELMTQLQAAADPAERSALRQQILDVSQGKAPPPPPPKPTGRYLEELKQLGQDELNRNPGHGAASSINDDIGVIRGHLHENVPALKSADEAFAANARKGEAIGVGEKVPTMNPDEIPLSRAQYPGEQPQMKGAAVSKWHNQIDTSVPESGNIPERVFGAPLEQARVEAMARDPEAMAEFQKWLSGERQMLAGQKKLGNTTPPMEGDPEQMSNWGVTAAGRGNFGPIIAATIGKFLNAGGRKITEQAAAESAPIIASLANNPEATRRFVETVKRMQQIQSRRAGTHAAGTVLGTNALFNFLNQNK